MCPALPRHRETFGQGDARVYIDCENRGDDRVGLVLDRQPRDSKEEGRASQVENRHREETRDRKKHKLEMLLAQGTKSRVSCRSQ